MTLFPKYETIKVNGTRFVVHTGLGVETVAISNSALLSSRTTNFSAKIQCMNSILTKS
uniref:Uncharacterized protein n=1 Tax=Arundo donax TaxID=35708 RepID=A0A0A9AY09_ARUDO